MFGEQRTRTLLGPADPARRTPPEPPRLSARELIAWAESTAEPRTARRDARLPRRMVLATGAIVAAAGAGVVIVSANTPIGVEPGPADPSGAVPGRVLVPVAYRPGTDEPAGPRLRALAGALADAPYENSAGRFTYHHKKVWGDPVMTSPGGRFAVAFSRESKVWWTPGGTGRQRTTTGAPEYPDQASRDYWAGRLEIAASSAIDDIPLPPFDRALLPADRPGLAGLLKTGLGAGAVSRETGNTFGRYAVPRRTRAEILRILADVPGFRWRGEVTDRAGRDGVAVTFDDREHSQQHLLIFHPRTGELLASELLTLGPLRMNAYELILATDRTDHLG
ncbi:CU044_5270 family protein [Catellatospora sichuanensis]|uniref:CU044_5270 family protein n=1 Tax=Catellatospora sichuanensis TaxID=1969805 RepID=UPI0011836EBB|nr:CU044_5270 family protein [Catellatospora sichuanensis]